MFYFNFPMLNFNMTTAFGASLGNYCSNALFGKIFGNSNYSTPISNFYTPNRFSMPNYFDTNGFDTFTSSANAYTTGVYNTNFSGWNFTQNWNVTPSWNFTSAFSMPFSNSGYVSTSGVNNNFSSKRTELGARITENAEYYIGKVNDDATGNKLFSGGVSQAWCADFVTSIMKKSLGDKFPSDFGIAKRGKANYGSSSVFGLKYWAQDKNCYMTLPASGKGSYIASNIKPGDIMIEAEHTGIVTKVFSDGSFETVEGNYGNKVAKRRHSANEEKLVGFISMEKYA